MSHGSHGVMTDFGEAIQGLVGLCRDHIWTLGRGLRSGADEVDGSRSPASGAQPRPRPAPNGAEGVRAGSRIGSPLWLPSEGLMPLVYRP